MLNEHSGVAACCHQVCGGAVRLAVPQPEEGHLGLWLLLGPEAVWEVAEVQGPLEVDDLLGQFGSATGGCPSEFLPGVNLQTKELQLVSVSSCCCFPA